MTLGVGAISQKFKHDYLGFHFHLEINRRLHDEPAEWTTSGDRGSGNPTLI